MSKVKFERRNADKKSLPDLANEICQLVSYKSFYTLDSCRGSKPDEDGKKIFDELVRDEVKVVEDSKSFITDHQILPIKYFFSFLISISWIRISKREKKKRRERGLEKGKVKLRVLFLYFCINLVNSLSITI